MVELLVGGFQLFVKETSGDTRLAARLDTSDGHYCIIFIFGVEIAISISIKTLFGLQFVLPKNTDLIIK